MNDILWLEFHAYVLLQEFFDKQKVSKVDRQLITMYLQRKESK